MNIEVPGDLRQAQEPHTFEGVALKELIVHAMTHEWV